MAIYQTSAYVEYSIQMIFRRSLGIDSLFSANSFLRTQTNLPEVGPDTVRDPYNFDHSSEIL